MKVNIRGLAFVGFAAAVFAQSAIATEAAYNEQNRAVDEKTVTSKYYVDKKFNGTVGYVATQGTNRGDVAFVELGDDSSYIDATAGAGKPVTGKAVAQAMNLANINGNTTYHTEKVPIYNTPGDATSGVNHYELVIPDSVIADDGEGTGNEMISGNGTRLTTVSAVMEYSETLTNKLATNNGETITASAEATGTNTSDIMYPTVKNVYDFVKAENASWQPKVVADDAQTKPTTTTMYVGKYIPAGTNTDAEATWDSLTTGTYVTNTSTTTGVYTLDLDPGQLVTAATDIVAAADAANNTLVNANASKLATASAVHGFAVRQNWGTSNANKTLVTDSNGNVALTTMPRIPELPNECKANSTSVHCALVSTYYQEASGNIPAGTTVLEWTVMANAV